MGDVSACKPGLRGQKEGTCYDGGGEAPALRHSRDKASGALVWGDLHSATTLFCLERVSQAVPALVKLQLSCKAIHHSLGSHQRQIKLEQLDRIITPLEEQNN